MKTVEKKFLMTYSSIIIHYVYDLRFDWLATYR